MLKLKNKIQVINFVMWKQEREKMRVTWCGMMAYVHRIKS